MMSIILIENLAHIIHKFLATLPGRRRDVVSERIFLPIFLQHVYMDSRGKNPRPISGCWGENERGCYIPPSSQQSLRIMWVRKPAISSGRDTCSDVDVSGIEYRIPGMTSFHRIPLYKPFEI